MSMKTPPGFCEGKPWQLIEMRLERAHGERGDLLIIPQGMEVAEHLHEFYWAEVENYTGMLAAGVKFSDFFVINGEGIPIRASAIDDRFGAHEMAFLCCLFIDLQLGRVLWVAPKDITPEMIATANKIKGVEVRHHGDLA